MSADPQPVDPAALAAEFETIKNAHSEGKKFTNLSPPVYTPPPGPRGAPALFGELHTPVSGLGLSVAAGQEPPPPQALQCLTIAEGVPEMVALLGLTALTVDKPQNARGFRSPKRFRHLDFDIPCPGAGCPLCATGERPVTVLHYPVYVFDRRVVMLLRVWVDMGVVGPNSLGARLQSAIQGRVLARTLLRIERSRADGYTVIAQMMPEAIAVPPEAMSRAREIQDDPRGSLRAVYTFVTADELRLDPDVQTILRLFDINPKA